MGHWKWQSRKKPTKNESIHSMNEWGSPKKKTKSQTKIKQWKFLFSSNPKPKPSHDMMPCNGLVWLCLWYHFVLA